MADELTEEDKAERAKEFRVNLNRKRPSRKRYGFSSEFLQSGALEQSSQFDSLSTSGVYSSGETVPLQQLGGGDPIYRDISEKESLSKWKNGLNRLLPQPIKNALLPPRGRKGWLRFLFVHLPVLQWLWTYRPKQLIGDIIAGITIGVTHIPQGIGFALLANLPPVYGLYSSFVPVILYSIFGTSRHISVGTFPVVALMAGNAITRLTADKDYCPGDANSTADNATGSDDPCFLTRCETDRVDIAISLSLLVGIMMICMSLLRLGFITLFLSDALVSGYTAAAAFTVFVTQIRFLFGLDATEAAVSSGIGTTPRRVVRFCELIFTGKVNGAAIVTAVITIFILISLDYVNKYLRKYVRKIPLHIPAQLIVVILVTGISYGAMLSDKFDLPVISDVGGIPPGKCYGITLPRGELLKDLIADAIIISIISFVINISQAKLLAKKNCYSIHPDQEFFAYGIMNFGGAFFGSFPTAGALSRTILQDNTGGNTQLVGFLSSGIVIITILFLGSLFGPLPNAALASIVVVALKGLYFQVRDIYKFFRLSWPDMFVWLVVFLATLLIGLDIGLGVGVLFSLIAIVVRTILPFSPQLGETKAWHFPPEEKLADDAFDVADLKVFKVPKIFIFQFNAPLYFANSGVFRSRLYIETGINPGELKKDPVGCFQQCCCKGQSTSQPAEASLKDAYGLEVSDFSINGGVYMKFSDEDEDEESLIPPKPSDQFHTIVLDCGPIVFVDSMGTTVLEQMVREYDSVGIQVLLAAPAKTLCGALQRHGFFKRHSSERLFHSVASAVHYAKDGHRVPELAQAEEEDITLASNLERQLLYTSRPSALEATPIELESRVRSPTLELTKSQESTV